MITLFLLATAGLPAQQKALVRCDALVGFNGTAREDRFAPVILSIENPGARMSAVITLRVTWGGSFRGVPGGRTIRQEAVLDAGATRRIAFTVPLPRSARSLQASVTSGGVVVGSLGVELRPMTTPGRIIAVVSSELSLDGLATVTGSSESASGGATPGRVVYPRVDDLPQGWAGYDGVDAVIVHDTSFQQLRADQVTALEKWVVTGGILAFTGGAAALQHAPAGFDRLLPVQLAGLTQRTGLVLSGRRLPGKVEVIDSRVRTGKVLAADAGLPLIVRRTLGRGTIWFLAFDPTVPPVIAADGMLSLWRLILAADRIPAMGAAPREPLDDPWVSAMLASSPSSFPPVLLPLLFIACFLALLLPLAAGTREKGHGMRPRTRLVLLVAVSLFATAAGWVLFNRVLFRPGLQVLDAARLDARSGEGLALVTEKVGFFSSSAQPVEVRLGTADAVVEAGGARTGPGDQVSSDPPLLLSASGSRTVVNGLDVERLATRLLVLQQVVALDVRVRAEVRGSTLEVVVENGDVHTLRGCFILREGRAFALGDVAGGAAVRRVFDLAQGVPPLDHGAWFLSGDPRRAGAWKAEAEMPMNGGPVDGEGAGAPVQLVAWLDGPVLPVTVTGGRPLDDRPGLGLLRVEAE
jgi:hypothetical protein